MVVVDLLFSGIPIFNATMKKIHRGNTSAMIASMSRTF